MKVSSATFRALVREALRSIPPELQARVHNVDIVIERWPSAYDRHIAGIGRRDTLLGLYHGVPLTVRGEHYNLVPPDKISIYQEPIQAICRTADDVREQVRKTVLHELAHHFGISDERLTEIGMG